jgi:tubulin polyglutamylase TTLL11
MNREK